MLLELLKKGFQNMELLEKGGRERKRRREKKHYSELMKALLEKNGFKKKVCHILTSMRHMMPFMQCMASIHHYLLCKIHTRCHHIS
jgi:predicted RNA-binding protein